jgi:hypothetical protein
VTAGWIAPTSRTHSGPLPALDFSCYLFTDFRGGEKGTWDSKNWGKNHPEFNKKQAVFYKLAAWSWPLTLLKRMFLTKNQPGLTESSVFNKKPGWVNIKCYFLSKKVLGLLQLTSAPTSNMPEFTQNTLKFGDFPMLFDKKQALV